MTEVARVPTAGVLPEHGFIPTELHAEPPAETPAAAADMTMLEFFERVWPKTGLYIVARFVDGKFRHQVCDSIPEAEAYARQFDTQGVPTYFAVASFRERRVERKNKDGETYQVTRVQENVRSLKTFFMDLDVHPSHENKFASQEAAIDGLVDFCTATGLPIPMCVSSGFGIHTYFCLTDEISPDQWKTVSEGIKALCAHYQFKADPACTGDSARVLRPVGTWNRKDPANPRPVGLVYDADPIAFEQFRDAVLQALQSAGVKPPEITPKQVDAEHLNDAFKIKREYPPISAHVIADRCQQFRQLRDKKGCIPEPYWFAALQLAAHTIEGDSLAHKWSAGYSGYSYDETQQKLDRVRGMGPSLCKTFESRNPGGCAGCSLAGKISSPAQIASLIEIAPAPMQQPVSQAEPTAKQDDTAQSDSTEDKTAFSTGENTRAESQVPLNTRPVIHVLEELNDQYAWVDKQKQIFRFKQQDFIKPNEFRLALANRPPVMLRIGDKDPKSIPPADAWLRWPGRREHWDIVYEPGKPAIFESKINLWPGWGCNPVEGDITPWREILDEAFGCNTFERKWFEQWAAYPIQNPGAKMHTAVLLWHPNEGLGKSLIADTLKEIYGPNAETILDRDLDGHFNPWGKCKQFIAGEEITSNDQRAGMNRLKHLITGKTIWVDDKWQPKISLRNTINFIFTSNQPNALHIGSKDRRMFVVRFSGKKRTDSFFQDYANWLYRRCGREALMHHLLHVSLEGFNPNAEAPRTSAKDEMIDASFSDIERWVRDNYTDSEVTVASEIVYAGDLVEQYNAVARQRMANQTSIGNALSRFECGERRVVMPNGKKRTLRSIRRIEYWKGTPPDAWVTEYFKQFPVPTNQVAMAGVPHLRHS